MGGALLAYQPEWLLVTEFLLFQSQLGLNEALSDIVHGNMDARSVATDPVTRGGSGLCSCPLPGTGLRAQLWLVHISLWRESIRYSF